MDTIMRLVVFVVAAGSIICQDVVASPLQSQSSKQLSPEPRALPEEYRLNDDVWPSHYDVEIKPYFEPETGKEAFTFDGITTITVTAMNESVSQIKLHKAHLDILSWSVLRKSNSQAIRVEDVSYDEETQIFTLHLSTPLLKNVEYYLIFNYVGTMEENMRGFYRSYYLVNGKKVWLGSTQFEQTEARRAFPCFDEPKYKSTFTLKLNYKPLDYKVFSNTPVESEANIGNNRRLATFKNTPMMSTYLLAFVVAPYELNGSGALSVLARPEAANQTEYGVREGLKLLERLGAWIDYPFNSVPEVSRMYMAAVPDFAAGAMENWGLITYRESSLLYVEEDATSLQQQRIATIISHELAHQWFGNLVTCEWWDVTWLNEGFATYLEYFGTALVEPSWELEQQFVVEKLHSAFQVDGSLATHPMTHAVYTPTQAAAIFDGISYNKGGVVLRMMEHFMSNAVFKTAMRDYVKDRQFNSSRPEDLFAVLNSHKPHAGSVMKPWTTQPGFPLVTVTGHDDGFALTQKRFLTNGTDHNDTLLWPLPITYATSAEEFFNTNPTIVDSESYNISMANASDAKYFVLNNQQVGYYRVNYDGRLWDKISEALRSKDFGGIHVLNRAQIVDDLFNLARADIVSYSKALDMLGYLKDETEYVPWLAASSGFNSLSLKIHQEDERLFSEYVMGIFAKVYEHVKFQAPTVTERRVHTYLRRVVLDWTCRHGDDRCTKSAVEEFERFRANSSVKVHPDLRQVVYCEGVRQGSTEQFDFLLNLYLTANVATEQLLLLQGMSCASEEAVVHKFMNLTSSPDVRMQDKATALSLVLSNQYALESVTSYLVENSERWAEAHGGYGHVAQALNAIVSRVKDTAVRQLIEEFAEAKKDVLGPAAYELMVGGLTEYDNNQQFIQNHRKEIREFLMQTVGNGATQTIMMNVTTMAIALTLLALCRW